MKEVDVMVDLETLGTSAGCVVLSIGAIAFYPKEQQLGRTFYHVINQLSCAEVGLFADSDTVDWWNKQSLDAREVFYQAQDPNTSLRLGDVLTRFETFIKNVEADVRIWGNGADFDLPILGKAYLLSNREIPWKPWNGRCYRTLKNLSPETEAPEREGVHHHALDDAKFQARHALALFRDLGLAT